MAHFFEALGLVVFFAVEGHHTLIRALAASFDSHPVGAFTIDPALFRGVVVYASGIFLSGLQVAAPVFAAMIVVGIALAILAKVAPQLQVMMFAFPVKILGGLLLLAATLVSMLPAMADVFDRFEAFMHEMTVS